MNCRSAEICRSYGAGHRIGKQCYKYLAPYGAEERTGRREKQKLLCSQQTRLQLLSFGFTRDNLSSNTREKNNATETYKTSVRSNSGGVVVLVTGRRAKRQH